MIEDMLTLYSVRRMELLFILFIRYLKTAALKKSSGDSEGIALRKAIA